MQNLENLEVFEILITQNLLNCPKDPFVRSTLMYNCSQIYASMCECKHLMICKKAIFVLIFMKCSPNCRAKELGMLFTIVGSFCSILDWEQADVRPQNRPRKIPRLSCCWDVKHTNKNVIALTCFSDITGTCCVPAILQYVKEASSVSSSFKGTHVYAHTGLTVSSTLLHS